MPLDPSKLETILRAGDTAAILKFFHRAKEPERTALAPMVKAWCQRLERNWRAQFDRKVSEQVKKEGPIGRWMGLMPAAYLAALATLGMKQIESIHLVDRPQPDLIAEVLRDRRPNWTDEYAQLICGDSPRRWATLDWKVVRHLVREGLSRAPESDAYVLGAIEGIRVRPSTLVQLQRQDAGLPPLPEPSLVELLLAERDWLATAFWRLFELEGTGEVSLANGEKYSRSESWTTAIVELSQSGVLSRERLLDASLAALNRDFIQFRAGWFSRFHEAMSPTAAEREQRLPVYFQLLGSAIPPTVTFALKAIQVLDKAKPIAGAPLAQHLESVLTARSKTAVMGALQLLDRAVRRERDFAKSAGKLATLTLLHESPDVQESGLDFLKKHAATTDSELRAKVAELASHVASSLQPRLEPWLEKSFSATPEPNCEQKVSATPPPARLAAARALKPIANLDELILAASAMLESPADPMAIELVLDGGSRLSPERPHDFSKRTGPLRKRALKKRDDKQGSYFRHPYLDRALAMWLLTWLDGKNGFTEDASKLGGGENRFTFMFRRLERLGKSLATGPGLPLLSTPTHQGGWIEPQTLVTRWLAWQKAGLEPDLHEQVAALLRLAPEARSGALAAANTIKGEAGAAVRFALGEKTPTGANAALWLAAWRSRQPFGDLPEFEKTHPKLGPDAGAAAQYAWHCEGKDHEQGESKWRSLELATGTQPKPPELVADTLLPVLAHGKWWDSEDNAKPAMLWAVSLWPAHKESYFAYGAPRLAISINYADAMDRDFCAYLEPLADPHTDMRPMATLALVVGLAAQDVSLRGHAQEGLIAAIQDGRLDLPLMAETMSRLLSTGVNKLGRWGKALQEVARVSPWHANQVATLLVRSLRGDATAAPRDIYLVLEVLVELLAETGRSLTDTDAQAYLQNLQASGRTAKLVQRLTGNTKK